jgi:hypothetical protein
MGAHLMSYDPAGKFGRAYKRDQVKRWRDRDGGLRNRLRRRIQYHESRPVPDFYLIDLLRESYAQARAEFSMPRGRTPRHASH